MKWFDRAKISLPLAANYFTDNFVFFETPELLDKKLNDYRSFSSSMFFLMAIVGPSLWFWDYITDPEGAINTVWPRLSYFLISSVSAVAFKYVRNRHLLASLTIGILLLSLIIFVEILNRLNSGMIYGVGGFMYFTFFSLIFLSGFSLRLNVIYTLLAVAIPHLLAIAGFAHGFQHSHYAALIWIAATLVILVQSSAARNYQKRYEAELALNFAKERAENATKLKDKFLSLVSHDLKGPLGAIRGMSELTMNPTMPRDVICNLAKHSYDSSNGLLEMIDKLLNISRLQTGSIRPDKTGFDVIRLSQETAAKIAPLAQGKGIRLINEILPDARLFADRALVGELLLNLLTNAVKFTPRDGTITLYTVGVSAFAVRNTGAAISAKILPDLFRHDVKTVGYGTAGEVGTGLGLPFCQDIMAAHGGGMRVESGGTDTVFFAEFPHEKPIVMLVDDQEVHRIMMKEQIEKISAVDFVEASSGEEALERLNSCRPVLVISDINMPDKDGFELLKGIRKLYTIDELPVIISTALSGAGNPAPDKTIDNKSYAFELGANDFIMKPIIPDDFIPRVKRYL